MTRSNQAIVRLITERRVKINLATGQVRLADTDTMGIVRLLRGRYIVETSIDGEVVKVFVHRLVAYLKYGERLFDPALDVHHKDLDKRNNRASNLCLVKKSLHKNWHRSLQLEQDQP